MKNKIKNIVKENILFIAIIMGLSIYYVYRMFHIAPWYDELYTYLCFTNKGVWYSATHWPLPNNHIFFSMSSATIRWCGIYIGLRGISLLAALGTICLLYKLFQEKFSKVTAAVGVLVYSLFLLTNQLAIQGRGYSLATFFLALAIYNGFCICYKEVHKKEYLLWGISLWLGLYTLVSSIYWVVAICVCVGLVLLIFRKYRNLLILIASSAMAAILTLISYGLMWFSLGAQQISNDPATGCFGVNTWSLVLKFPRTCLLRGMRFMLEDQYVQGIERSAFLRDFKFFARDVLGGYVGRDGFLFYYSFPILVGIVLVCLICFVVAIIRKKEAHIFVLALSSVSFVMIFLTLLVQSAYPFVRVFSFMGLFLIMPIELAFSLMINLFRSKANATMTRIGMVGFMLFYIFVGIRLLNPAHMAEYEYKDYFARDAIRNIDWDDCMTYLATEVYSNQQVEFYQVIGKNRDLLFTTEEPDVIITRKNHENDWTCVVTQDTLDQCYLSERPVIYENELYIVYGK